MTEKLLTFTLGNKSSLLTCLLSVVLLCVLGIFCLKWQNRRKEKEQKKVYELVEKIIGWYIFHQKKLCFMVHIISGLCNTKNFSLVAAPVAEWLRALIFHYCA